MTLLGTVQVLGRYYMPVEGEAIGEAGVATAECLDMIAVAGCLLAPDEAEKLADLIREAVGQCRSATSTPSTSTP